MIQFEKDSMAEKTAPEVEGSGGLAYLSSEASSTRETTIGEEQPQHQHQGQENQHHNTSHNQSETSWAALSQIVASFFITFNTWGIINTFGVFQTYYRDSNLLDRSNSDISWIGSLQACLILATLIITGPLFDRGLARTLTYTGLVLDVVGIMMTSLATKYWQLMLCQGLCMGLGYGCLFIVAVGQLALTFKKRRWMALGIAQSGGSIGAIIYSEMFRKLQPSVGAAWATRTIGFIMLGTLIISAALLRPHKLPKPRKVFDADAFRSVSFDAFAVASLVGFMGLYIPFFYIQEYSLAHGLANRANLAFSTLAILNTGSVFGRIVPGFIADEFGLVNTYFCCTVGAAVFGFIWIACTNLGGLVVFALFYGFFSGCTAALQPAVLASLAPQPNLVGTWVGIGSLFSSTGLLLGNPFGGLVLDRYGWTDLQLFCACLVLACALATACTRISEAGPKLLKKI